MQSPAQLGQPIAPSVSAPSLGKGEGGEEEELARVFRRVWRTRGWKALQAGRLPRAASPSWWGWPVVVPLAVDRGAACGAVGGRGTLLGFVPVLCPSWAGRLLGAGSRLRLAEGETRGSGASGAAAAAPLWPRPPLGALGCNGFL